MSEELKMTPCAKWEPDCQGKWDYDGRIVSVSSRYWSGAGMTVFDTSQPEKGLHEDVEGRTKPSAVSHIVLNHGEPDQYGYGESLELASAEFDGDTEAEVKAKVEAWVAKQFADIHALLRRHYSPTPSSEGI